jgi:hypothetical protein
MKKQSNRTATSKRENAKAEKASDSDNSNVEVTESEDVFTQEDFENALRRVSRRICEPDAGKIET